MILTSNKIIPQAILGVVLLTSAVPAQAQTTTKEVTKGAATVNTSELKGEVLSVEGNDLAVKLSTGDVRVFHVPPTRKFVVDSKELSVGDLQPGTTLTATVKTTTTPVTVRTKSMIEGKVWYVSPPNVILTLSSGENKAYKVSKGDNVEFVLRGKPATVFDLRKGMEITAQRIVEEPDTEIVTDTTVTGHAPAVPVAKEVEPATPPPVEVASSNPPAAEPPKPAVSEPEKTTTSAPSAAAPSEPAASAPSSGTSLPLTEPTTNNHSMLWVILAVAAVIIVIVMRAMRAK